MTQEQMRDDVLVSAKWLTAFVVTRWAATAPSIQTLVWFMAADLATGLMAAWVERDISSAAAKRGIAKKAGILILLLGCHRMELYAHTELGAENWLAAGYIVGEFISFIENLGRAGVNIPPALLDRLKAIQKFNLTDAAEKKLLPPA
jgi:toxin secretion/phage lysis holin